MRGMISMAKEAKTKKKKAPAAKKRTLKRKRPSRSTGSKEKLAHDLIPVHVKVSEKEKEDLFKVYNVTMKDLPKIFIDDPAIRHLDVKENDVIKITRKSPTAGTTVFYRGVINE